MLAIKGYKDTVWKEWHVGDGPLPATTGYGVEIRADGHELTWLMDCIREGQAAATKQYYKETWGVDDTKPLPIWDGKSSGGGTFERGE